MVNKQQTTHTHIHAKLEGVLKEAYGGGIPEWQSLFFDHDKAILGIELVCLRHVYACAEDDLLEPFLSCVGYEMIQKHVCQTLHKEGYKLRH